jgi:hypothetical protein
MTALCSDVFVCQDISSAKQVKNFDKISIWHFARKALQTNFVLIRMEVPALQNPIST